MDSGNFLMQTRCTLCQIRFFWLYLWLFLLPFDLVIEPDILFRLPALTILYKANCVSSKPLPVFPPRQSLHGASCTTCMFIAKQPRNQARVCGHCTYICLPSISTAVPLAVCSRYITSLSLMPPNVVPEPAS